jgi:cysteine desulfurase
MEERIKNTINDIFIYGDVENRLPNTSNIAFGGVRGDELLLMLESYDVFVSTGSACNSENLEPSHVLKACNANLTNFSPIRISLSKYNTFEEINVFIEKLSNAVSTIRRKNSKNL